MNDSIFYPPHVAATINLRTKITNYLNEGLLLATDPVYKGPDGSIAIGRVFEDDPDYADYRHAGYCSEYMDD